MRPREQTVLVMRLGVGWTVSVTLIQLGLHHYGAAFTQACVGAMTYGLVKTVLWAVADGERQALGPRLILRDDGRVCVTRSVRPWYKPVETCCGETVKPCEVTGRVVTCLGCVAVM